MNRYSASFLVALSLLAVARAQANDAGPVDFQSAIDAFGKECLKFEAPMPGAEPPAVESEKCAALGETMRSAVKGHLVTLRDGGSADFLAEAERLWPLLGPAERDELLPAIKERTGPKRPERKEAEAAPMDLETAAATEGLTDALNAKPGVGLARAFDNSAVQGALPAETVWGQGARRDDPRLAFTPPAVNRLETQPKHVPVPLLAFPEAPKGNTWSDWGWWAGDVVLEAGKRTAHSVAAVPLMAFEGIGTGIQAGGGLASIGLGGAIRRVGQAYGSADMIHRGEMAALRGEAMLNGTLARMANAVTRPGTVLLNPKYEAMPTHGPAGAATMDTVIGTHMAALSKEPLSFSKVGRYALAYTASFADKASQAILGGGVFKSMPGIVTGLTLTSVGVNAKEQSSALLKAYLEAKGPEETEAALAQLVKAGGDFAVMFGAGMAAHESGATGERGGARFIDSAQARDLVIDATTRLEHVKKLMKEHGHPEMPLAEQQALFQQLMQELLNPPNGPKTAEGPVGLTIFDNDAGLLASKRWQALGVEAAWLEKMGIVKDHHGPYFDPKAPEVDSTMKVLDRVEQVLAAEGKDAGLKTLRRELANESTNNLGDGAWADWISHNIERIVADEGLRRRLRQATGYEDFGFFGAKAAEVAKADPSAAAARELQHAAFRVYDEALARYGIKGSDRFDSLPPVQQRRLMAEVRKEMSRLVDDPGYRRVQAGEFESRLEAAKLQVDQAEFGLDAASREALAAKGVPPTALDGIFVYDAGKIQADGQFAGWGAAPQAHGNQILLGVRPMPDGRTGFILSVPNGMEAPSLASLGKALQAAEAAREASGKPGSVGGRDSLQFSFDGLRMTPQELLMTLAEARAKEQGGVR